MHPRFGKISRVSGHQVQSVPQSRRGDLAVDLRQRLALRLARRRDFAPQPGRFRVERQNAVRVTRPTQEMAPFANLR